MTPASDFESLLCSQSVSSMCLDWLREDIPSFVDVGGLVVGSVRRRANLYLKESGVFSGKPFFDGMFGCMKDCSVHWVESDGEETAQYVPMAAIEGKYYSFSGKPILLAVVEGPANDVLRCERAALCALSRCSGVSTSAHRMVSAARESGWKGRIAGTRKTTPGFRVVEKYGLMVGGADTHR